MDFSNIARQLNESPDDPAYTVAAASAEKATAGGQMQQQSTNARKGRQKAQMSQTTAPPTKSSVSYASEEARTEREETRMLRSSKSDWRKELSEALNPDNDPNHPYVDVMPFMNQKAKNAKEEAKTAAAADAGKQAKMAEEYEDERIRPDAGKKGYRSSGMPKKAAMNQKKKRRAKRRAKGESTEGMYGYAKRNESALNPFQVHFDKDGKEFKSKGSKSAADRIAKNTADNRKRGPMSRDPYKPRAGESD